MKLYPNLLTSVKAILNDIFSENRLADLAIEKNFRANKKFGSRDRKFVAETVYDVVRNLRLYSHTAGIKDNSFTEDSLLRLIHVSMIFRDIYPLNYEFEKTFLQQVKKAKAGTGIRFDIQFSIPEWLHKYGKTSLPDRWEKEMAAQHSQADVYLRVNTLKLTKEKAVEALLKEEIETESLKAKGMPLQLIRLKERKDVFRTESFKKGYFEVQDGGSQLIPEFLAPKPGERIIDACAGGGGKALQTAAIMKNKGKILAMDTVAWKLQELKKRAARGGVDIIETKLIENTKSIKRLQSSADKVLLDVPCSGSGVFRRNPDAKWKISLERINSLIELQAQILQDYSGMAKTGGIVVYATCSIFPQENGNQIKLFLEKNEGKFELLEEKQIYTSETGFDSFYMAKLKRIS